MAMMCNYRHLTIVQGMEALVRIEASHNSLSGGKCCARNAESSARNNYKKNKGHNYLMWFGNQTHLHGGKKEKLFI